MGGKSSKVKELQLSRSSRTESQIAGPCSTEIRCPSMPVSASDQEEEEKELESSSEGSWNSSAANLDAAA